MDKIKSIFTDYGDIVSLFSEKDIDDRYRFLLEEMGEFIANYGGDEQLYADCLTVNKFSLIHAVLDYYSDIARLKEFHAVNRVNEYKILAYQVYWILRRRPIQVLQDKNEELVFANEKFVLAYIVSFLTEGVKIGEAVKPTTDSFIDSFYYYLKYRVCTPQDIEMIVLAFCAGLSISNDQAE